MELEYILSRIPYINFVSAQREDLFVVESLQQLGGLFPEYWRRYRSVYERHPHIRSLLLRKYIQVALDLDERITSFPQNAPGVADIFNLPQRYLYAGSYFSIHDFIPWMNRQTPRAAFHRPIYVDASVLGSVHNGLSIEQRVWYIRRSLIQAFDLPEDFELSFLPTNVLEMGDTFESAQSILDPIRIADRFQNGLSPIEKERVQDIARFMQSLKVGGKSPRKINEDSWLMAEALFDHDGVLITSDFHIFEPFLKRARPSDRVQIFSEDVRFDLEVSIGPHIYLDKPFFAEVPVYKIKVRRRKTGEEYALDLVFDRAPHTPSSLF